MGLLESKPGKGNIVFNCYFTPIEQLQFYAAGYHEAGQFLVEKFKRAAGYRDFEAYPVFFLYRHSSELYLKAIAYKGAKLLNLMSDETIADDPKLFSSHNLTRYFPLLKKICVERKWSMDEKVQKGLSLNDAIKFIQELETIDPSSYNFRYPNTSKGVGALKHHTVLNVIHFGKTLDPVLTLLDAMVTGIDYDWDNAAEILYEVQEILKNET